MTQRIKRKELVKGDDAFLTAANQGASWLRDNWRQAAFVCTALVLTTGVAWGIMYHGETSRAAASAAYFEALATLDAEIGEGASSESGAAPVFASEQARDQAAYDAFVRVAKEGTDLAPLAEVYAGDVAQRLERSDDAIAHFQRAIETMPVTDPLYFLAAERLAYAYEAKGEHGKAAAALEPLLRSERAFYRDGALYQLGRLAMLRGDRAKGADYLEELEQKYPESPMTAKGKELLDPKGAADLIELPSSSSSTATAEKGAE